jgi:D-aminopeptidase
VSQSQAVGRLISESKVPSGWEAQESSSSIIVIIATDAPLIPTQCRRLAQRATTGLARVGGIGNNSSGDIFLAFATGNHLPAHELRMLRHEHINPLFRGVAEATDEAILNALCAVETMVGFRRHKVYALPHSLLREALAQR